MKCKLCGGECEKMGVFGLLEHWLCRNCGMWWNRSLSKAKMKPKKLPIMDSCSCGGAVFLQCIDSYSNWIQCHDCEKKGEIKSTKASAINAWNRMIKTEKMKNNP